MFSSKNIKVGITHGDPNGIGYEVILKTFFDSRMLEICEPVIYGSESALLEYKNLLKIESLPFNHIKEASEAKHNHPNFINIDPSKFIPTPGIGSLEGGRLAFLALERAIADLKKGLIDVLVTAPIHKELIQSEDFKFPGHTEYLAMKDNRSSSLMFMVSENLKVAMLTGHIPVSEVHRKMSIPLILETLQTMEQSLKIDFNIRKPKIAVLGLNPHAGDNGLLGKEDLEIITPALQQASEKGMLVYGPIAADGFFGSGKYKNYDGVLAMYHDQGLIPFKTLAFGQGTNFTASLSFVRTSPDHGTGFEIAGKNIANEGAMRQAIYSAIDIYKNRKMNLSLMDNQLKVSPPKKEKEWLH